MTFHACTFCQIKSTHPFPTRKKKRKRISFRHLNCLQDCNMPSLPCSALLSWQDGIWQCDFVPVQRVLDWPCVVDRSIGKQDIVFHAVDKERCECDNKQQLTVRVRFKKKKKESDQVTHLMKIPRKPKDNNEKCLMFNCYK